MTPLTRWSVDRAVGLLSGCARASAPMIRVCQRLARLARLRAETVGPIPPTTQLDGVVVGVGKREDGSRCRARVALGERCRLGRGVYLETTGEGKITLGENVRVNAGCFIVSYEEVSIGRDCLIGEYVSIRDADHGIEPDRPIRTQPHISAPIEIGRDVWIARGSVILKGVRIGDGAVVAANSVVTKDAPSMAVVGGVPARVIKWRGQPRRAEEVSTGAAEPAEQAE